MASTKASRKQKPLFCICQSSDDSGFMIACDKCDQWFHGSCVGLTRAQGRRLDKFVCPNCLPAPAPASDVPSAPADRKRDASPHKRDGSPAKRRRASSPPILAPVVPPAASPAGRPSSPPPGASGTAVRQSVVRSLSEALFKAYNVNAAHVSPDEIAERIENELSTRLGAASPEYKARSRTLVFNLKDQRNGALREMILSQQLSVPQLVSMRTEDLAPQEVIAARKQRESKLASVEPEDDEPMIPNARPSGLSAAEDNPLFLPTLSSKQHSSLSSRPLTAAPPSPPPTLLSERLDRSDSSQVRGKARTRGMDTSADGSEGDLIFSPPPPDAADDWPVAAAETPTKRPVTETPPKRPAKISSAMHDLLSDLQVDLSNPEPAPSLRPLPSSSPPSSPRSSSSSKRNGSDRASDRQPEVVWRGYVSKKEMEQFGVEAQLIGGAGGIEADVPEVLRVVGRMELQALLKYIADLDFSSTRARTVVYLQPLTEEDSFAYLSTYEFLQSRDRAGVIQVPRDSPSLKEAFLVPLPSNASPPTFCSPSRANLADGREKLIAVFVTRKRSSSEQSPAFVRKSAPSGVWAGARPRSTPATPAHASNQAPNLSAPSTPAAYAPPSMAATPSAAAPRPAPVPSPTPPVAMPFSPFGINMSGGIPAFPQQLPAMQGPMHTVAPAPPPPLNIDLNLLTALNQMLFPGNNPPNHNPHSFQLPPTGPPYNINNINNNNNNNNGSQS